ncbi:MAG: N-(5'-phosphoribosyl)anthranilate isomerase [Fimbriimonadales bacterium]|nr:MAG: N-(5'-phosphoribosyl)anthranilate isomerase [Fimbriimonadales bacterium]
MWVKICGLTNEADAHAALEAGADALGFIFVRSSPRYVLHHSPQWQAWVERLTENARCLVLVLTVLNELPPEWRLFHAVQWIVPNGVAPSAEALRGMPDLPLWAAFRFPPEVSSDEALRVLEAWSPYAERFLLDTYHPRHLGGTGEVQDWRRAAAICARALKPTILAGGLNAANVADAVRTVQPAGVDVSSGVEASAGRKDHALVRAFVQNAKSALEGGLE